MSVTLRNYLPHRGNFLLNRLEINNKNQENFPPLRTGKGDCFIISSVLNVFYLIFYLEENLNTDS